MNQNQLNLNLGEEANRFYLLACGLRTKEVSDLVHQVTRKNIPPYQVRKLLKMGGLTVAHPLGKLRVVPSQQGKKGKFYIADVQISHKFYQL
jgi:hypothetical protein